MQPFYFPQYSICLIVLLLMCVYVCTVPMQLIFLQCLCDCFRAYDPAEFENLSVTAEIKELFQYITRWVLSGKCVCICLSVHLSVCLSSSPPPPPPTFSEGFSVCSVCLLCMCVHLCVYVCMSVCECMRVHVL